MLPILNSSPAALLSLFYCKIMTLSFLLFFILILLSISINNRVHAYSSNLTDQQALLSIRAYMTGDPSGVLSSWNHSIHFCQWKGITCSHKGQRVISLDLSSQQLDGTLSPHIGNLSFLRAISLDMNNFRGSIPPEVGQLFRLQYLNLGSNFFQGIFPVNLSQCSDIRNIIVEENNLEGKLPSDFTLWSKLDVFNARRNSFIGSIPSSIGNMSSLRTLDISRNHLTGSIPLQVARLWKLEYLRLSENKILGTVPLALYNISSIYLISLGQNELEGRLPADLGFTPPNLIKFLVGGNKFSGPFPPSIANASHLSYFDISSNNISGPLPLDLGRLLSLSVLNLGFNQLGHNQPPDGLSFLGSLVNSTHLTMLCLGDNDLSGELPNSIVNLSASLDHLELFQNNIHGSIPQEIGKLNNMTLLSLARNMLTGSIPESVCELSKLGRVFLEYNNISGVIPACINNITRLLSLSLGSNMLHGSIPTRLFNMSSLQGLSLYRNHLSGRIPEQIVGLSSQACFIYLDQNLLTGPLPSNIGTLMHLFDLRLSHNKLSGEIPASLGSCLMLEVLYLDGNLFEGRIPSYFKDLKNLALLDLSNNNISGNIPEFLGEYPLIQFLNVSHNKLEGEVPKKGVFSNISAFSVIGNFQLCGGIQAVQLPACPANISKAKKKQIPLRMIPLIILPTLSILLACLALIIYRHRKSTQKIVPFLVLQEDRYPRLSYQDLLLATNEFSLNNLLGEGRYGSVYKGSSELLQQIFAVKVLHIEVHGAYKSFLAECETLRNIRHRNLIKIITACSSTDYKGNDFKALVFEFMTNGSLENWLHPSTSNDQENKTNLTLFTRLNIAIDIALAVNYLHHHCPTKIIHCDIKPSNVLLDEEFVGRLSDFGLARFLLASRGDINHAQTSSTGVQGTVGYVPPEYGMGEKISAEGDVYSYGILLLELFTGQRPTGRSILMNHANNLHDYVRNALPSRVMEIVDPRIILQQEDHDSLRGESVSRSSISKRMRICLTSIFEVGVLCSVEMPRERIDISVAVKRLHLARDKLLWHE